MMHHHVTSNGKYHTSFSVGHSPCAKCEPCDGDDCWWYETAFVTDSDFYGIKVSAR